MFGWLDDTALVVVRTLNAVFSGIAAGAMWTYLWQRPGRWPVLSRPLWIFTATMLSTLFVQTTLILVTWTDSTSAWFRSLLGASFIWSLLGVSALLAQLVVWADSVHTAARNGMRRVTDETRKDRPA